MTRFFLILALLAQAPKSLPTPHVANDSPFLVDNTGVSPSVFGPNPCKNTKIGAKSCTYIPVQFSVNGVPIFTIADGDEPVGPGCDLGKLVRAARAYMDGIPISWAEPGFLTIKDGDAPGQWEKNGKLLRALQAELARCEPKPEPGR